KYGRGSQWRKMDLHFHTPDSYDYHNMSVTNDQLIDKLVQNGIELVVISDHNTINPVRITALQSLAADKDITVLPGIELCSTTRASVPVHFIGIFPEDSDLEYLKSELLSKLEINNKLHEGKAINEIYCESSAILREV